MKPKQPAPKPEAAKKPSADETIANLTKILISVHQARTAIEQKYKELSQDYLELAESIAAAATTSARIIRRHSIGRSLTIKQGVSRER